MHGGNHRDWRATRVDAMRLTGGEYRRKLLRPADTDAARIQPGAGAGLAHLPDPACNDIARREIATLVDAGQQRSAVAIAQPRAGTAERFADQRQLRWQRAVAGSQCGRMELDALQIAAGSAGLPPQPIGRT